MSVPEQASLRERIFRREALDHHAARFALSEDLPLRVAPPWIWSLFLGLGGVLVLGAVLACVFDVELTSRARGTLRAASAVRVLRSQVAGSVISVLAESGQLIEAGAPLVRIDAPALVTSFEESKRRLADAQTQLETFRDRQDVLFDRRVEALRSRARAVGSRGRQVRGSTVAMRRKVAAYRKLAGSGAVGSLTLDEVKDELGQRIQEGALVKGDLADIQLQIQSIESERQAELWRWEGQLREAQARHEALAHSLRLLTVTAPESGLLEAVLVHPGDTLDASTPVGRIVPRGAAVRVVALLPERDRAFAELGRKVRVSVDQLPYSEFGALTAQIDRIAVDLASPEEARDVLGQPQSGDEPSYRVEMTLVESPALGKVRARLRPGMLVSASVPLRKRRLIGLIFSPLRRAFEP